MYLIRHHRKARRKIYVPNWSDPELSGLRPDKYCHMSFTDVKDKTKMTYTRTFKDYDIYNATPEDQGCWWTGSTWFRILEVQQPT
eukprot:5338863-Amphidinium_carterae.2